VTIHTLPYLKCNTLTRVQVASHLKYIRLVSVPSSLPSNNIGVQIELTKIKCNETKIIHRKNHFHFN